MARMKLKKQPPARNVEEHRMVQKLDELAEFESFKTEILPKLRKAIKDNLSTKEITEMARAIATARVATIAAWSEDDKTALSAAKELLDRAEGKATEKKEITHKMANLKDEDLDALLITAINETTSEDE